jgi:hypothetical protein
VRYGVVRFDDGWTFDTSLKVSVNPGETLVNFIQIMLPRRAGEYRLRAELLDGGGGELVASSEKIAHVFEPVGKVRTKESGIVLYETSGEISAFLTSHNVRPLELSNANLGEAAVVVAGEGALKMRSHEKHLGTLRRYVENGGTFVVIEPELGVDGKEIVSLCEGVDLVVERRADVDKGGYDSYVFPEDYAHPLWSGIEKKHLQMFNGGYGGEVVSQHNVTSPGQRIIHARCGLKLGIEAVFELPIGKGRVLVSRLQLRGRLVRGRSSDSPFVHRPDPVLQRYFMNLLRYAGGS